MTNLLQAITAAGDAIAEAYPGLGPETGRKMATLAAPHIAAAAVTAERERIQRLGASPLAGKCAYEAFAAVTRQSLNLSSWERLPPDVHADWQATADAVLMLADLLRPPP